MTKHKGIITRRQLARDWPHRVALPSRLTVGPAYVTVQLFAEKLSVAPRCYSFVRGGEYWSAWCFRLQADAEAFHKKFGGQLMEADDQPKWPS